MHVLEQLTRLALELDPWIALTERTESDRLLDLIHSVQVVLPRLIDNLKQHPALKLRQLRPEHRGDLFFSHGLGIVNCTLPLLIRKVGVAVRRKPLIELLRASARNQRTISSLGNSRFIPFLRLGYQQLAQLDGIRRRKRLGIPLQFVFRSDPHAELFDGMLWVMLHPDRGHFQGKVDRVG